MSDGRGGPDVPRPENEASVPSHGTTPDVGGGFTDPAPGREGIIVQGGRTAPGPNDPRAIGPKQDDPRAIGPKQDDPRAIGPKQDDPRAAGNIVQGGRTGHPGTRARQKRAKKTKTMMLVIGGVMVLALGGFFVGSRLGHDPAALQPQAAATPTGAASADASGGAPSAASGGVAPAPASVPGTPATQAPAPPTTAAPTPPARTGGAGPTPGRSTQSAPPKQSSAPAPAAQPVLSLRPAGVREFCANGEWPGTLLVRNSGGGKLTWSLGGLPAGVTASTSGGSLAADALQVITLGGRTEQQPPNGRFTVAFTSDGGSGQVTVTCA
ncbi:hypothetical protein GCM10010302_65900 [Streptomyces polychromogenes]|uniref:Uncharacterized protein n=1 Tax=Streptomyces polychromogenes TaxID=67342 RepID=A0ABP3FIY4_9ACTN